MALVRAQRSCPLDGTVHVPYKRRRAGSVPRAAPCCRGKRHSSPHPGRSVRPGFREGIVQIGRPKRFLHQPGGRVDAPDAEPSGSSRATSATRVRGAYDPLQRPNICARPRGGVGRALCGPARDRSEARRDEVASRRADVAQRRRIQIDVEPIQALQGLRQDEFLGTRNLQISQRAMRHANEGGRGR